MSWGLILTLVLFGVSLITIYLSVRLRRGALVGGLIFAVVWLFFYRTLIAYWSYDSLHLALLYSFPCVLILGATFLFLAVPRHLVRCGGES